MKRILVFSGLVVLLIHSQLFSQSIIAPIGGEGTTTTGIHLSWTIGEIVSGASDMNDAVMLTQGLHQPVMLQTTTSSVNINAEGYDLSQNIPNPFQKNTVISLTLPRQEKTVFSIFDLSGKEIYRKANVFPEGRHQLQLSDSNLPASGTYFYRVTCDNFTATKKLTIIK